MASKITIPSKMMIADPVGAAKTHVLLYLRGSAISISDKTLGELKRAEFEYELAVRHQRMRSVATSGGTVLQAAWDGLTSLRAIHDSWPVADNETLTGVPNSSLARIFFTADRSDKAKYMELCPEWFTPPVTRGSWIWPPK